MSEESCSFSSTSEFFSHGMSMQMLTVFGDGKAVTSHWIYGSFSFVRRDDACLLIKLGLLLWRAVLHAIL